jgi:hypothetical protein
MTRDDLIGFYWLFQDTAGVLYDEAHGVNYPSEDYFEDLAAYVVARGKHFFEQVRDDPSRMPKTMDADKPGIDIQYEASKVYRKRFGEPIPAFDG